MISNGSQQGFRLTFNTLGVCIPRDLIAMSLMALQVVNGLFDEYIQAPYYPEFAVNNTYGIVAVNDTVYNYMRFACYMRNGCLDQVSQP